MPTIQGPFSTEKATPGMAGSNPISIQRNPRLHILPNTKKGRGVFAAQAIAAGTVVETCPVLIIPPEDVPAAGTTILNHFSYNWPYRDSQGSQRGTTQAIALGLGSIFNHSKNPNVGFRKDVEQEVIVYTSLRDMRPGEELCISYGPRLWFEDVEKDEDEKSEENESTALNGIQVDLQ